MRFEFDTMLGDFDIRQAENLETTRVGKSRFVPTGKCGETTGFFDEVGARSQNQVISVREDGLRTEGVHLAHGESLYRSASGGADKGGRFDVAVGSMDGADTSEAMFFNNVKF